MSVLNFICCITFKIFFILSQFLKHPTQFFFFSRLGLHLFDNVYNFILKFFLFIFFSFVLLYIGQTSHSLSIAILRIFSWTEDLITHHFQSLLYVH